MDRPTERPVTGEAAVCFGCGGRFAAELLEDVGDTVFCRSCLGRMLRRVDERARGSGAGAVGAAAVGASAVGAGAVGASAPHTAINGTSCVPSANARPKAERAAPARTLAADAPCFLCGDPLEGGAFIELRGFAICARCSRGLIGDDAVAGDSPAIDDASLGRRQGGDEPGDPVGNAGLPGDGVDGDDPPRADRSPRSGEGARAAHARVIETPGSGTEWCSRCGRPMPGPGSYVLVDGRPHCAACAAARAHRSGAGTGPATHAASDDPTPGTCDACCRVLGGSAPEIEGFRLCAACRSSDLDLALAIARARHQRLLARTGRRLLDGDDD